MHPTHIQTDSVARFACLGAKCPDTCCKGWSMQVAPETRAQYEAKAPELLDALTSSEAGLVMRRDPVTDICVKFDHGLCAIHRDYGDDFLGDACHFFPRITRALGPTVLTTMALSCPESARQMLYAPSGFAFSPRVEIRTPYSLKSYLPEAMSEEDALALHAAFMDMAQDEAHSAEENLLRISNVARALERQPHTVWRDAFGLYAGMAQTSLPAAEPAVADMFNLLHALHGIVAATGKPRVGLAQQIEALAEALGASFHPQGGMALAEDALALALRVAAHQRVQAAALQPVFRRYLAAQLSQALFPFAGLGETLAERITIIGVRFATVKLALALLPVVPEEGEVVRVIQQVSRCLDHLADATLSLAIYRETGWLREPRLRALLGA